MNKSILDTSVIENKGWSI